MKRRLKFYFYRCAAKSYYSLSETETRDTYEIICINNMLTVMFIYFFQSVLLYFILCIGLKCIYIDTENDFYKLF